MTSPRIGILNLMPHAAAYERMLLPQFSIAGPIDVLWLSVEDRRYHLDDLADIRRRYTSYAGAVAGEPLDGLVVTGAAVEHLPFEEVRFMPELRQILLDAAGAGVPILGLCWGALAVGHVLLGLEHEVVTTKYSGVYPTRRVGGSGPIADSLDDVFAVPHSRFAGFAPASLERRAAAGAVEIVARSDAAGVVVAQSPDASVVMHIGHPEYAAERLPEEYARDVAAGLKPAAPAGVDLARPVNTWRSHSLAFFAAWIRHAARASARSSTPNRDRAREVAA